jgi:hypothetical protein
VHGLLTNKNKNSGEKINSDSHPLAVPPGVDFLVFLGFLKNVRRRSIRVLKLHRGFLVF